MIGLTFVKTRNGEYWYILNIFSCRFHKVAGGLSIDVKYTITIVTDVKLITETVDYETLNNV
jgi:hypothetical protein